MASISLRGEAWHNTVYEGGADVTRLLEPVVEIIKIATQFCCPQLYVFADAIHQMVSVLEDKLARQDDKALGRVAVESAEAVIEQLREFGRIG